MQRKVAIAGLGTAARTITLPALARLSSLAVVGGCDPVARAGGFPFPVFLSAEEMLEKARPDILVVATPPASHFDLVRLGLDAGCHVFCEKPFMNTLEEADQALALARERRRWIVVNNQFRFMNIHLRAKQILGSPDVGDLRFLAAQQTFFVSEKTEAGWRGEDRQRTCKDFGTHILDLCRFFFDEDPISVTARMPRAGNPAGPDYLNLIQLEFSGDRVAHITLDRLCRGRHRYLELRLDGSTGCVETHVGGGMELSVGVRGGSRKPYLRADLSMGGNAFLFHGERSRKIASDPIDVFAHATGRLLAAFLDALDKGGAPPCNGEDNRRTLALMLAAYESQETNGPVLMRY